METEDSTPVTHMPQLPEEIWAIIASKMTTMEWMSVSRTCRTMYSVQPSSITLMPRQIRDFRWLIKHWKQVRDLSLDMELTKHHTIAKCAMTMMKEVHQLSQLKLLKLSAPVAEDLKCSECVINEFRRDFGERYLVDLDTTNCPICEHIRRAKGDEWSALLACFVQQAAHVQTLSFKLTTLDMPLVNTLKHLLINVEDDIEEQGCRALQQLQCLETLYISHQDWEQKEELDVDDYDLWEDEPVSCCRRAKALDMRGSKGLSVVRFVMVAPESVRVPPGCHVSIECDFAAFLEGLKMLRVPGHYVKLPDACDTWHLHDYRDTYHLEPIASAFSGREPIANIISLRLDCSDYFAGSPLVVGQCLQKLRHLEIRSDKRVYVKFSADVRLERFVVMAGSLQLVAPDLAFFADSIRELYMCLQSELCPATAVLLREHLAVEPWPCSHKTEVCFPADADWEQYRSDACRCGACSKCLGLDGTL